MKVEVMKITKLVVVSLTMGLATGCASHSGVVPMSQGKFMITKQAATSLSGIDNLKAEVMQEAKSFCGAIDKDVSQWTFNQTKSPNILGNYTRVELQFSCVVKPDVVGRSGRTAG